MEKKSNHQVKIVRISEILPHTNADTLELIHIGGYQVVVKKGEFKPGDLGVYIQPDSVVPQTEPFRFIWEPYVQPMDVTNDPLPYVPERRRRITVRKFRKEWSEGLLLPVIAFPELEGAIQYDGDSQWLDSDVSDLLGITHYDPDKGRESTTGENEHGPGKRSRWPRSAKGWFFFILFKLFGYNKDGKALNGWDTEQGVETPVYDVESLKNFKNVFEPGEMVWVTEKIHGSNARFVYTDGKMYVGSRTLWKSPKSSCVWRKALQQNPWIEEWCKANPGHVLYGEVTPTQKGFDYGCKEGEVKFFVFDIRTPEGEWKKPFNTYELMDHSVPVLYYSGYMTEPIAKLVDGPSLVPDAKHIREGVVITALQNRIVRGLGRPQLKIVSNTFLEKDGK